jgi:hypothetical protein
VLSGVMPPGGVVPPIGCAAFADPGLEGPPIGCSAFAYPVGPSGGRSPPLRSQVEQQAQRVKPEPPDAQLRKPTPGSHVRDRIIQVRTRDGKVVKMTRSGYEASLVILSTLGGGGMSPVPVIPVSLWQAEFTNDSNGAIFQQLRNRIRWRRQWRDFQRSHP